MTWIIRISGIGVRGDNSLGLRNIKVIMRMVIRDILYNNLGYKD